MTYNDTQLLIDGVWAPSQSGKTLPVVNPATGETIGTVAHAGTEDLDRALAAAAKGFDIWRKTAVLERSKVLRKAADIIRERLDHIATLMVMEQGKPFAEAKGETALAPENIEWMAEEGRRSYGRVIPARQPGVYQMSLREPVGVVAAFTPWNFPINQAVKKVAAALAAGCAMILKGPEETPASVAEMCRAFMDAGLPPGVLNLVYGVPAEISSYLVPHPTVRKISFTGSTVVGKHLAAMAGQHMKRVTMELGGHAPAIIFDDANLEVATKVLAANKFRNAGQVCIAPTRFLVQQKVYDEFVGRFTAAAEAIKVGDGLEKGTTMGPLANDRRIQAMEGFIADAVQHGGEVRTGGKRIGNKGNFFEPTVMTGVPTDARVMNEEPFGPLALMMPFHDVDEAISEANRLAYGLAAYAYTSSAATATKVAGAVESGMMSINHHGLALPETPFGGVKDSGYGSEGGVEGLEAYLSTKFVTQAGI
jgi:succinate-semialdehyde dehydrogenase/glutarate-semialdehyde dehydrogenase